jgi:hypothetical protein
LLQGLMLLTASSQAKGEVVNVGNKKGSHHT